MRHSTRNFRPALERLEERALLSTAVGYLQLNLVSNIKGIALKTDPSLVDPWGVNFPQKHGIDPPVYVADQGTGVATAYQISSDGSTVIDRSRLAVTIPTVGRSEPTGPTGVVQNTHTHEFLIPGPFGSVPASVPATYIFDTLQGTIEGYSPGANLTSAEIMVNNSSTGAEYTGLATGTFGGQDYIYAANDGTKPGIQVFNSSFSPVNLADPTNPLPFTDPYLPAGFMPYGVRDLSLGAHQTDDSDLFVTYRGANFQGGAVAEFHNDGTFVGQIASDTNNGGNLQSPWGLAFIKQGFDEFSGDLLVGNFSSGQIDAYKVPLGSDPSHSGKFLGKLPSLNGTPLTIPGLRTIHFGPGLGIFGSTRAGLLFTAGFDSRDPTSDRNLSLYGEITPAVELGILPAQDLAIGSLHGTITPPAEPILTVSLKGSSFGVLNTAASVLYSIQGGGGVGAFNVSNFSGTLSTIGGPVTLNGGGGADSLAVDGGRDGTSTYGVFADSIFGNVAVIDYPGMASVVLNGSSSGGSIYAVSSTSAGTSYSINAGAGADAFDVSPLIPQVLGAYLDAIAGLVRTNGGGAADSL